MLHSLAMQLSLQDPTAVIQTSKQMTCFNRLLTGSGWLRAAYLQSAPQASVQLERLGHQYAVTVHSAKPCCCCGIRWAGAGISENLSEDLADGARGVRVATLCGHLRGSLRAGGAGGSYALYRSWGCLYSRRHSSCTAGSSPAVLIEVWQQERMAGHQAAAQCTEWISVGRTSNAADWTVQIAASITET